MAARDIHREGPAAFALGALDTSERLAFEAHLADCDECRVAAAEMKEVAARVLARAAGEAEPVAMLKERVIALAEAPRGEVDVTAYRWIEIAPGIRAHEMRSTPTYRSVLIWAEPGARHPSHRHLGEEDILVLKGALQDERGIYRVGEICRSRRGEIHSESIVPEGECICFAVYYGGGIEHV
jgi:anti-sigma factor ChrR (cupin superfamily)